MKPTRDILVVDDETVITHAVQRVCTADGLSVDVAVDAAEAMGRVLRTGYKLIISDVMMADVDGFAFLTDLRRRRIPTPVILTTGMSTVQNAVRALGAGAIDFIPKPFTSDELLASVHRGLVYARLQAEAEATSRDARPDSIAWVPPPPSYYRLGYASWLMQEHDGTAKVGVTDLFLRTLDSVQSLALAADGEELVQGSSCAMIKAADGMEHALLCPVSGRVVEVNSAVTETPAGLERDPYFEGWLYRVLPSELQYDLQHLTACSSDRM
jgi:CheY-like chemotaxis protein/glycine cleavage system H lipoate-binding protein